MAPAVVVAAAVAAKIFRTGQAPPRLERFSTPAVQSNFLDLVQFLLRIQKTPRHRIAQQSFAVLLEIGNFLTAQRHGLLFAFRSKPCPS